MNLDGVSDCQASRPSELLDVDTCRVPLEGAELEAYHQAQAPPNAASGSAGSEQTDHSPIM